MIYHVYANQSNAGDWLSARGIQSLLAPRRVRELCCDAPFVADTIAALRAAGPDDFVLIGGGGLFMDYFAPFWREFRAIGERVPFAIWGVGACDLKRASSRLPGALIREMVRHSRLCVVRDELTRELLGADLPSPVACPSIIAVPARGGETPLLLHVDHYNSVGPENFERMVEVADAYARQTGRAMRRINNLIARGDEGQLEARLNLYAAADLVLSSRLHGCILALATGRRVLAVSGDHKIEAFMRAAGLAEWVLDFRHMAALPERLRALPTQRLPTEFVLEERRRNRSVAAEVIALLPRQKPSVVA